MKKLFILPMLLLSSCTTITVHETQPSMTASAQYLIAQSAENAINQFSIKNPSALGKVYLDNSNFDGSKYTFEQLQTALLKDGVSITTDPKQADTIISVRVGVQSIDNRVINMGTPNIPIPLPFPIPLLSLPQITIISKDQSIGVTLIGLTVWDAHTGLLIQDLGQKIGLSYNTIWSGIPGTAEHNDFDYRTVPSSSGK